jgi:hypothetical protein
LSDVIALQATGWVALSASRHGKLLAPVERQRDEIIKKLSAGF